LELPVQVCAFCSLVHKTFGLFQVVSSNSKVSDQLIEINKLSASLSDVAKSVSGSDKPVSKPVRTGLTSKDLSACFEAQQKSLEKVLTDLKLTVVGGVAAAGEKVSVEAVKRSEESEKRLLEALNRFDFCQSCLFPIHLLVSASQMDLLKFIFPLSLSLPEQFT